LRDDPRFDPDPQKLQKVAKLLMSTFPNTSESLETFHAKPLVSAPHWGSALHHAGSKDVHQLKELEKSLRMASKAINALSEWTSTGFDQALLDQEHRDWRKNREDEHSVPASTVGLQRGLHRARLAARLSLYKMKNGRASHGKNWQAIALIDDARKTWETLAGTPPPRKKLNPDTKFARFLEELFDATNVGMGVSRAYDAWYDYATYPNSLIDL